MSGTRGVERSGVAILFLALCAAAGTLAGCGEEGRTGLWLRVTSPDIRIDRILLEVHDADAVDPSPELEHELYLPTAENPDLWVLLFAGSEYEARAIRVSGKGFRGEREVAHGDLERLEFRRGSIVEAEHVLVLTHDGSDDDQDGFYVPDDCDDLDPSIHPEATEFCDELDNNCDGTIDEGCPCSPGLERECWPQWAAEPAPGSPCAKGLQRCEGQGWGACTGLVLPVLERCPGGAVDCFLCLDAADNDCDGFVDHKDTGCGGCEVGTWLPCYTGLPPETEDIGLCHGGQKRCLDGDYGPCEGEVTPEDEICDGRDNDCADGVDEAPVLTGPCALFQGVCSGLQARCVDGLAVDCTPEDYEQHARATLCLGAASDPPCCTDGALTCYAAQETGALCDRLDNDCNGLPDDAVDGECTCSVGDPPLDCPSTTPTGDRNTGECNQGHFVCVDGQLEKDAVCVLPAPELCDNRDNDCDATTDLNADASLHCLETLAALGKSESYHADLSGCSQGVCRFNCQPGYWDLQQDRSQTPEGLAGADGCEYACVLSTPLVERCDGLDNDCDGLTDGDDTQESLETLCPGRPHASVSACLASACDYACATPYEDCNLDLHDPVPLDLAHETSDGCEINLSADVLNCGACDRRCATDHATVDCQNFACVVLACDTGWDDCNHDPDDACERPLNTLADCGACDVACALAHASESCATRTCLVVQCDGGWGNCNPSHEDGCETDLTTTTAHCGSCGHACLNDHGSTSCLGAACVPVCDTAYGDCNGQPDDGCEADLWQLTSCGVSCASRVNCSTQVQHASGKTCANGTCDYSACDSGYGNCDGSRPNGCETSLWQAGACGTTCQNLINCNQVVLNAGGVTCSSGACDFNQCNAGFGNCDNDRTDGCEENLWLTASCGNACAGRVNCNTQVVNATGVTCANGLCDYGNCSSGFGNCDNDRTDGCEESIWQLTSCGTTCGNRLNCSTQVLNATGVNCANGLCDYSACTSSQYASCDGVRTNGCEVNLWQTASCGTACAGRVNCNTQVLNATGITCATGACDYSACSSAQYASCDGDRTNGCELNLWQTTSCGTACAGRVDCNTQVLNATGKTCASGACDYAACSSAQYRSCDGDRTNGCELNLWQTTSCGTACAGRVNCNTQVLNATGITCATGACDYGACSSARYANCDGDRTDGCEVDLYATTTCGTNCGNLVNCNSTVLNATGVSCGSGTCDYESCNAGYGDCDGNRANGCEVDLDDPATCGLTCAGRVNCNTQVQHATGITCSTGVCGYTACTAGYGDCDGDATDGCEENIREVSDCGTTCANRVDCNAAVLNATGLSCTSGTCDYTACSSSQYADCDADRTNGCELDLRAVTSCGTTCLNFRNCNTYTSNANGRYCNAGTCDYATCIAPYDNCNLDRADGCERSLTLAISCGDCANDCTADAYDRACVEDGGYRCGCSNDGHCDAGDPAHDVCNTGLEHCQ